ncbi:TMEM14 family protein [Tautonia rosea]|uniref:TMEM14 family protein n=1 Tax=Tautonia rosea TaxID=2728037 RepID=UPI001474B832|nr:TMEM14 family protein [Tautonia rosea]
MTPTIGSIVLFVYGLLLILGGVMGASAGSKVSLIAGGAFGVLAVVAAAITAYGSNRPGLILGGIVALLVMGSMAQRFMETKKFMPAGMTAILSLIVLVLVVVIVLRGSTSKPMTDPGVSVEEPR